MITVAKHHATLGVHHQNVAAPLRLPSSRRHIVTHACLSELPSKFQRFVESGSNWNDFALKLFLTGSISGPLLDAIHSRTQLQIYDSLPLNITAFHLDFHSSLWVSPLLGLFYVVLGTLHPLADFLAEVPWKEKKWAEILLSFGALAFGIEISAWMYENGYPYATIHATLCAYAILNWLIFERSWRGCLLAVICAIGSPLGELPILIWLKWWHYPHPDALGLFPSWVIWCYFFYTPAVGNFARKLWYDSR